MLKYILQVPVYKIDKNGRELKDNQGRLILDRKKFSCACGCDVKIVDFEKHFNNRYCKRKQEEIWSYYDYE